MSIREMMYALLAVLGLLLPWHYNLQFMAATPGLFDLLEFVRQAMVNPASASLSLDLIVAFTAYCVFVIAEARRIGMRHGWIFVALGLCVAFACAFPLFLLLRERHLRRRAAAANAATAAVLST